MELEADLVVFNGNIITMDPQNPKATALAVKSYKILTIGNDDSIVDLIPNSKRVIDLGGKTVVPGFVDAHTHLTSDGVRSNYISLGSVKSLDKALAKIREELPKFKEGKWVFASGWDESTWPEKRYLDMKDLDTIPTEQPILAVRVDGHLVSVNSVGFRKLKLPPKTPGIVKDKKGKPTGVLKDIEGIYERVRPTPEEYRKGVVSGNAIANELGITTAIDNAQPGVLKHIREVEAEEALSVRMVVNPPVEHLNHMIKLGLTSGMGSPLVKIGGVKIFTDGSIGAATAAVSRPYRGTKNTGMLLMDRKEYSRIVKKAVNNDIQTVTHAIGDAAIQMVLEVFDEFTDKDRIRRQRHRIEHAEMINEYQIRWAVSMGLILSMQPNFVARWQLDGGLYDSRFDPERVRGMNMFRVALDNGARLCFGSDGMPYGPLYGIWAATTHPNERVRLTAEEALRCYTLESAHASFLERFVGSLIVGKRADFVVLSDDILSISPKKIRDIEVEMTVVGGLIEYSAAGN
ncbi:MAG: amidohydrolase [Candidatus Thorarchaeota archaeon]|nr:amidohydrolase [Candidatus Thorarchaeota archaeon]